jgi:hypothetical protein
VGVLASLAQAIAPLLLAVAPGGAMPASPVPAASGRSLPVGLTAFPVVLPSAPGRVTADPMTAGAREEAVAVAGLADTAVAGFTPATPDDRPIGMASARTDRFPLTIEQQTLLPQAAGDSRFVALLTRAGVSPESAQALLPALVAALGDRISPGPGVAAERSMPVRPGVSEEALPVTLGAAMLQSLASQSAGAVAVAAPAATAATVPALERIEALQQTLAETVSRLLVSDPLHDGRREVRLTVAQEILPNTEIRLWRHENRIHVEFIAPAGVLDRSFGEGLPRLAEAIQQRQPQFDLPVVTVRGQGGFEQPGDGRSRQQYQTQEELEGQA